jgi:hypothetical protein
VATRKDSTIRKNARQKTFHDRFRETLEAFRMVTETSEKIRWQLKECGTSAAFLRQQKNVKHLLSLIRNYDVESVHLKEQKRLQGQLKRVRELASAYNDEARQGAGSSNIEKMWETYWAFVFEMQAFCTIAAPELLPCYVYRLGVAEELRHRKIEELCRTRGARYAVTWATVSPTDDREAPSAVIESELRSLAYPVYRADARHQTVIAVLSDTFGKAVVRKVAAKRAAILRNEIQFLSAI